MPYSSPIKKSQVVELKAKGLSNAAVAKQLHIDPSTVSRINAAYKNGRSFYEAKPKTGRPRRLKDEDVRKAVKTLESGKVKTATAVKQQLFPTVSLSTVTRALHGAGLHAYTPRYDPLLTDSHMIERNKWAFKHAGRDWAEWRTVIFTDESKYNLVGSDGHYTVWSRQGQELNPKYTKKMIKFGGGSIMVWGSITSKGVGVLYQISGTVTAVKYIEILNKCLPDTLKVLGMSRSRAIFQQDHASVHTAKKVREYFEDLGMEELDWAPQSPDMNPIEHVWGYLDRRVRARPHLPMNVDELWWALQDEWTKIPDSYVKALYDSMPRRVKALREARGGSTKYRYAYAQKCLQNN